MNACLAKPIPLGLVYCDPGETFGDAQIRDAAQMFTGVEDCIYADFGPRATAVARQSAATSVPARDSFCGAQSCSNNGPARRPFSGHEDFRASKSARSAISFEHDPFGKPVATDRVVAQASYKSKLQGRAKGHAFPDHAPFALASCARRTSILRSSSGPVTRSGNSSRSTVPSACMSRPSGSQPVQRQSAVSAPSSRVA
jgi:hypothetical protein